MPWVIDDKISKKELPQALQITGAEYSQAKNHMMGGGLVKVWAGELVLTRKPEQKDNHEPPEWINGSWHHEPIPEPDPEETEGLEDETENHNGSNDAADSD